MQVAFRFGRACVIAQYKHVAAAEFLRKPARKIAVKRRGRALQHAHIILIEAGRRQIYAPASAPALACSTSAFTSYIAPDRF